MPRWASTLPGSRPRSAPERRERGGQREGVGAGAEGDGDGLEVDAVEDLVEIVEPLLTPPSAGSARPLDQATARAPGEVLQEVLVGHLRRGVVDPLGDGPPAAPRGDGARGRVFWGCLGGVERLDIDALEGPSDQGALEVPVRAELTLDPEPPLLRRRALAHRRHG